MRTKDTYSTTQEQKRPPVLRTALRNVKCSAKRSPSSKPACGFCCGTHRGPSGSLPAPRQASATGKSGCSGSWGPSCWPSSPGPHRLPGRAVASPRCRLCPGKRHTSQTWAEPCFSAVKDLYLFINQKPDTKAAVFNIYAGVSKPRQHSRAGVALSPCMDSFVSNPWAWTMAAVHKGPPPTLVPPPVPQQATVASSSPLWTWDQAKGGFFSCTAPQGRDAAVLESSSFATSMSPGSLCVERVSSGPWWSGTYASACSRHPCLKRRAVQGHLCFLCAIKGSAAGRVSCVCSNKLSSARAHHRTWLFILLNYWNAPWLAFGQVVLSQTILRHSSEVSSGQGLLPSAV